MIRGDAKDGVTGCVLEAVLGNRIEQQGGAICCKDRLGRSSSGLRRAVKDMLSLYTQFEKTCPCSG